MPDKVPVPKWMLSSGYEIPTIGLGTWQAPPGEVGAAVGHALALGYRLIDCAYGYGNEAEIGEAIQAAIKSNVIKREELFIISKVWNTFHSAPKVRECIKESLKHLQVSYLDMYLIHWPMGYQEGGAMFPKNNNDEFIFSEVDYLETWKGLELAVKDGLVKSIGLSNFNSEQVQRIIDHSEIKPSLLEVELHPYFNQSALLSFCQERDIRMCAYGPFGSPNRPWAKPDEPNILDDPKIQAIAKSHKKSAAQVILRWNIQREVVVVPKSVTKTRLEDNLKVHDFSLTDEEMGEMLNLDQKDRLFTLEWVSHHKYWPFKIPF